MYVRTNELRLGMSIRPLSTSWIAHIVVICIALLKFNVHGKFRRLIDERYSVRSRVDLFCFVSLFFLLCFNRFKSHNKTLQIQLTCHTNYHIICRNRSKNFKNNTIFCSIAAHTTTTTTKRRNQDQDAL